MLLEDTVCNLACIQRVREGLTLTGKHVTLTRAHVTLRRKHVSKADRNALWHANTGAAAVIGM